ncbi:MAG TPA: hypothetical protein VMX77_01600 [Candidatus Bathyarchaeia archaeon]|nr:hypothetical protein [Candidatus Bathyarchaeia archaeon]
MATFLDQLTEEKGKIKLIREDRVTSLAIKLSLVFLLGNLILLLLFWQRFPPQVPLFFSRPWGESQLGPPAMLFLFPFLSLVLLITNFILIIRLIEEEKLLAQILASTGMIFIFLCLVALYQIIRLTI